MPGTRKPEHGSRFSARWRIVGWIILTTAVSLLAVMVTLRSVLLSQVATQANHGIVQEVDEFSIFASEGVDPATAAPFASATAMMERYLARQTPATGETLIGVTPTSVVFSDNAAADAGEILAGDRERLQAILDHPDSSGVTMTPHGELRWGRTSAQVAGETGTLVVGFFTQTAREQVDRDTYMLLGVALGGLLLTAGMAWLAAGQILRPMRSIGEVAARVDANELTARVPVQGRDDIARLAVTFNEMLDRLERSRRTSRHFVLEAQRQLGEPRARIASVLDQLAEPDLNETARADAAREADHQLDVMRVVLAELDLLSQAERPDFLTRRAVASDDLTRRCFTDAVALGADRQWAWDAASSDVVHIDPERTASAVMQLSRNAYEHTRPGAPIQIGSQVRDEDGEKWLRIWVLNEGTVIGQEEAEALLERYRASHDDMDDASAGAPVMGLGLAVVRAVADAHGGSAWVESSEQEGTRFGLDLPSRPQEGDGELDARVDAVTTALRQER